MTGARLKKERPPRPEPFYESVLTVDSRDQVPSQLGRRIFVIKRGGRNRWVIIACPCGCGDRIEINLMRSVHPHWRLRLHQGSLSLWPSLWVSSDRCGSHFILVRNRVLWVRDNGPWT
jgi:uncharacterized protein DUF6527